VICLAACAVRVVPTSDAAPIADDATADAPDVDTRPPTVALPLSVRAITVLSDGTLALGGSWSGEVAFAGESPQHDPAAPAWRGALAWIDGDRRVRAARVLAGREVNTIPAEHGVAALTQTPDGALWAVLPAGNAPVRDQPVVLRFVQPGGPAEPVASLVDLGDYGIVEAALAPHEDGVATCVQTHEEFAAMHSGRTVRVGRAWCGWVMPGRAPREASFEGLGLGSLPTGFFVQTHRAGIGPRGSVWTLRSLRADDPERWDSLRPEERAGLERRAVLDERASFGAPLRSPVDAARLSSLAMVALDDGRIRSVSETADGRLQLDDLGIDRTALRTTTVPPLRDASGHDGARGMLVAHALGRRGLGLVLAQPSEAMLSVLEISHDGEARRVAVTPDLRGASQGPVVLAETAEGWVLAQSGRLDGPNAPIRAALRWLSP